MDSDPILSEAACFALKIFRNFCPHGKPGAADCDWYHSVWPTLRLLDCVSGAKGDEDFFQSRFRTLAAKGGFERVLITGAADYAMLEQVAKAFSNSTPSPKLTIIDQCRTALGINRWFSDRIGLSLQDHEANALTFSSSDPFDLITSHSIFSFIPRQIHPDLVANWRKLLRNGGLVITSQVIRPGYDGPEVRSFSQAEVDNFVDRVLQKADKYDGDLPMDRSTLADMARNFANHKTTHVISGFSEFEANFTSNGFVIENTSYLNRGDSGHRSASPDLAESMFSARIVARAI